jgi:hypothetical protein
MPAPRTPMSGPELIGVPPLPYSLVLIGLIRGAAMIALLGSNLVGLPNGGLGRIVGKAPMPRGAITVVP